MPKEPQPQPAKKSQPQPQPAKGPQPQPKPNIVSRAWNGLLEDTPRGSKARLVVGGGFLVVSTIIVPTAAMFTAHYDSRAQLIAQYDIASSQMKQPPVAVVTSTTTVVALAPGLGPGELPRGAFEQVPGVLTPGGSVPQQTPPQRPPATPPGATTTTTVAPTSTPRETISTPPETNSPARPSSYDTYYRNASDDLFAKVGDTYYALDAIAAQLEEMQNRPPTPGLAPDPAEQAAREALTRATGLVEGILDAPPDQKRQLAELPAGAQISTATPAMPELLAALGAVNPSGANPGVAYFPQTDVPPPGGQGGSEGAEHNPGEDIPAFPVQWLAFPAVALAFAGAGLWLLLRPRG